MCFLLCFVFLCISFLCAIPTVFIHRAKIARSEARVSLNDYRVSVLFAEKHSVELDLDNEEKFKKIKIKYITVFIFFRFQIG